MNLTVDDGEKHHIERRAAITPRAFCRVTHLWPGLKIDLFFSERPGGGASIAVGRLTARRR
jgi:hypothetical protein